jgi:hypothetical protein
VDISEGYATNSDMSYGYHTNKIVKILVFLELRKAKTYRTSQIRD